MRVAVVEDSALLREGLVQLLAAEGHTVTLSTADALTLLKALHDQAADGALPDVVVLDVRLPPTFVDEGILAALEIRHTWPGVGVLVLSQYVERQHAADLLTGNLTGDLTGNLTGDLTGNLTGDLTGGPGGRTGGVGYLLKDRVAQVTDFLDALDRVHHGSTAFDPEVVRRLLRRPARDELLARLTPREHDVLALLAEGLTNPAIGERLHLSQSSVEKHTSAVFDKLGLSADGGYSRRSLAVIRYLQLMSG